ncbi:MAG: hypothetical protein PWR01_1257 [Clostridiales bacterium]|jgi:hypothetical protein|nr:hypothetical protein [Clostridiales bacterium]
MDGGEGSEMKRFRIVVAGCGNIKSMAMVFGALESARKGKKIML